MGVSPQPFPKECASGTPEVEAPADAPEAPVDAREASRRVGSASRRAGSANRHAQTDAPTDAPTDTSEAAPEMSETRETPPEIVRKAPEAGIPTRRTYFCLSFLSPFVTFFLKEKLLTCHECGLSRKPLEDVLLCSRSQINRFLIPVL